MSSRFLHTGQSVPESIRQLYRSFCIVCNRIEEPQNVSFAHFERALCCTPGPNGFFPAPLQLVLPHRGLVVLWSYEQTVDPSVLLETLKELKVVEPNTLMKAVDLEEGEEEEAESIVSEEESIVSEEEEEEEEEESIVSEEESIVSEEEEEEEEKKVSKSKRRTTRSTRKTSKDVSELWKQVRPVPWFRLLMVVVCPLRNKSNKIWNRLVQLSLKHWKVSFLVHALQMLQFQPEHNLLFPRHEILSEQEKQEFLKTHQVEENELRVLDINGPECRLLCLNRGTIVRVCFPDDSTRNSYRIVGNVK